MPKPILIPFPEVVVIHTLMFQYPFLGICWRRSWRGHDHWLTSELDPGNGRHLTPSPVLGMHILPTVPTMGAVFKDGAMREQRVVETIWTVHTTEPR